MTKLCRALFKCENKLNNWLRKLMHSFEVRSNESARRKSGRLGLEQVFKNDAGALHSVFFQRKKE